MSRLIEKLTRLRQAEPQPLGFAAFARPAAEKLKMQLLVCLSAENQENYPGILGPADGALITVAKPEDLKAVEKVCQTKDGIPAGGWLRAHDSDMLQKALESSCDFVVFPDNATLAVTRNDKLGRILELDSALSESLLRTVGDLPVDAVLISEKWTEQSMTLNRLMLVRRLVHMISKPILVSIPDGLTAADLQSLWDMGISGVIVEAVDEGSVGKLAGLRQGIDKLTPPAARKREKSSALLPRMQAERPEPPESGEEEDE